MHITPGQAKPGATFFEFDSESSFKLLRMADGDADYSPKIARNLQEILQSDRFVTECFKERNLKISQALCLLWHNQTSGEVPGRKSSAPLYGNVTAAVIIDLFVLGKFNIAEVRRSCLGIKYKTTVLEVRNV